MSDRPSRFTTLMNWIGVARVVVPLCIVAAVAGLLLSQPDATAGYRLMAVAVGIATLVLVQVMLGILGVLLKVESTTFRLHDLTMDIRDAATRHTRLLEDVAQQSRLSDLARSIASREPERELIRRAFNESLIGGDFEAAYYFADMLEERHGYKQEAERLRRELTAARQTAEERYVEESVERVQQMFRQHDWERARVEIDRLARMYPNSPSVQALPEQLRLRRTEQKRRLLKEWDQAVQRNEIDRGIAILKELDLYLTPNEAAALEESARGVFRAKLHNMGVQFSLAVTERQWPTALSIGQDIINEFPNSRMAAEVREHLEALKVRAARESDSAVAS